MGNRILIYLLVYYFSMIQRIMQLMCKNNRQIHSDIVTEFQNIILLFSFITAFNYINKGEENHHTTLVKNSQQLNNSKEIM